MIWLCFTGMSAGLAAIALGILFAEDELLISGFLGLLFFYGLAELLAGRRRFRVIAPAEEVPNFDDVDWDWWHEHEDRAA